MDQVLEDITEFASSVSYGDLPEAAVRSAKERIIDSLGCALGATGCDTAELGLSIAPPPLSAETAGRIVGTSDVRAADAASFVNSCLIRYLDFNDTYPGGHPSDALGALFALAPQVGATKQDLITATVIAYEVFIRLQLAGQLRERGWDQGLGIGVGAAAGAGRLLGLDREQLKHAVAITAVANVPMRATRAGQLSLWKGAATAYATRNATFGAQLAAAGMTGPEAPFTGRHGLEELITGPLEYPRFGTGEDDALIPRAKIKYWPVVYNMQALVWAGIELSEQVGADDISDIEVSTYWSAWHESGSEPAKWDPQTRATADHSLPYILAWTLRHGSIDHSAFERPESYQDESLRPLMNRIRVRVDEDIERDFPDVIRMVVRATDRQGGTYESEVVNPLGHEDNPVSGKGIEDKFRRLCARTSLSEETVDAALEYWWADEDAAAHAVFDLVATEKDPVG